MKNLLLVTFYSLLVLVLAGSARGEAKKINPHREQKYCLECHTNKGYQELKKSTFELCAKCHEEISRGELHPLEGLHSQTTDTVQGLPLKEGKIVCSTCHEPCTRTVYGEPKYYRLLRKEPNDLCLTCHQK